jgi:hypothetical protein
MDQGFDLLVYTLRTDAVGPVPRGSSWIRAAESHVRVQIEPCGPVRIRDRRRRIPRLRTRRARLWGRSARHPERGMACALRRVEPRLRRGLHDRRFRRSIVTAHACDRIYASAPRRRGRSLSPSARHPPPLTNRRSDAHDLTQRAVHRPHPHHRRARRPRGLRRRPPRRRALATARARRHGVRHEPRTTLRRGLLGLLFEPSSPRRPVSMRRSTSAPPRTVLASRCVWP